MNKYIVQFDATWISCRIKFWKNKIEAIKKSGYANGHMTWVYFK